MRPVVAGVVGVVLWALAGGWAAAQPAPERALAGALVVWDGVTQEDCDAGLNPEQKVCIALRSPAGTVERGIAVFSLAAPDGFGGAAGILGRTPELSWGYWFATQNTVYHLLTLPGEMIVCGEGDGVNVREYPALDAAVVAALPDLKHVQVTGFMLTEPGSAPRPGFDGRKGEGWYRLSAPVEGWAHARYLSNTEADASLRMSECGWRNLMERGQ